MSGFLERTKARTEAKREEVAQQLLTWEAVAAAIGAAAGAGANRLTIAPAAPLKIKHTLAAIDVMTRLTKAGFRAQWIEHRAIPTGPAGDQLEIEW